MQTTIISCWVAGVSQPGFYRKTTRNPKLCVTKPSETATLPAVSNVYITEADMNLIHSAIQLYYGEHVNSFRMVLFDYPEQSDSNLFCCTVYINMPLAFSVEKQRRRNETAINEILKTLNTGTRAELAKQIFDYLDKHASYDADSPDMSDLLFEGKGSCNAYATLFRLMCLRLGIPCDMIVGYTSNGSYHAWNRILTEDGSWLYFDIPFWKSYLQGKYSGGISPLHNPKAYNQYLNN